MVPWRQWVAAVCGGDGPQRSAMAHARSPVVSLKPIHLREAGTDVAIGNGRSVCRVRLPRGLPLSGRWFGPMNPLS